MVQNRQIWPKNDQKTGFFKTVDFDVLTCFTVVFYPQTLKMTKTTHFGKNTILAIPLKRAFDL